MKWDISLNVSSLIYMCDRATPGLDTPLNMTGSPDCEHSFPSFTCSSPAEDGRSLPSNDFFSDGVHPVIINRHSSNSSIFFMFFFP